MVLQQKRQRAFNAHSPGGGGSGLVQYVFRSPARPPAWVPHAGAPVRRAAKRKTLYIIARGGISGLVALRPAAEGVAFPRSCDLALALEAAAEMPPGPCNSSLPEQTSDRERSAPFSGAASGGERSGYSTPLSGWLSNGSPSSRYSSSTA